MVVDPVVDFSTLLGGNRWDSGRGIAVDTAGNVCNGTNGLTGFSHFQANSGRRWVRLPVRETHNVNTRFRTPATVLPAHRDVRLCTFSGTDLGGISIIQFHSGRIPDVSTSETVRSVRKKVENPPAFRKPRRTVIRR